MKKLFSIMAITTVVAIIIVACKDNFNESDFLRLQSSLKNQQDTAKLNQQKKALNDAGELLSFTVQIVEDRTPLAGVEVTISNGIEGSSKITTDNNGNAVFLKARVGSNTLLLNKTGYITSTAIVDFGSLAGYFQTVAGANGTTNIVPLKQSRSVLLPMFSVSGTGSTAKIQGKVTIETDLTNKTPEIPQNLTIRANYASGIAATVQGTSGVNIISYSFNQTGIGVAVVDNTTGLYSMTVPATAAGLQMSLLLPAIDANQKVAVINLDGTPIATGPQYRSVPVSFGPTITPDFGIPSVPGATAIFPAPPAPGAGLSFDFAPVPGSLSSFLWNTRSNGISPNEGDPVNFDIGYAAYQLTSRGSGYTSSPTIALTGGGTSPTPTQATMKASISGLLTSLTVGSGGSGYLDGDIVTVTFRFKDNAGASYSLITFSSTATVSGGAITSLTIPASGYGFDTSNPFRTITFVGGAGFNVAGFNVASFEAIITGGTGAGASVVPVFTGQVDAIKLENAGKNYTSAPTITFTGGGSSSQATMVVKEFRTQWYVTPNNSTNTTSYSIMPTDILFEFTGMNFTPFTDGSVSDQLNNSSYYRNHLRAIGGSVVQIDPNNMFRTNSYSAAAPKAIVMASLSMKAQAIVSVSSPDGFFNSLIVYNSGSGYDKEFAVSVQPTISGAPGNGATLDLGGRFFYNPNSGEYSWNTNYRLTNVGSGYLADLNQQNSAPVNAGAYGFTGSTGTFTIKTNDVQVFNFNYGTGKRKENVN